MHAREQAIVMRSAPPDARLLEADRPDRDDPCGHAAQAVAPLALGASAAELSSASATTLSVPEAAEDPVALAVAREQPVVAERQRPVSPPDVRVAGRTSSPASSSRSRPAVDRVVAAAAAQRRRGRARR